MRFKIVLILCLSVVLYANKSEKNTLLLKREDGSFINYYIFKALENIQSDELLLILQGSDCNSVLQKDVIFKHYRKVRSNADLLLIEKYGITKNLSNLDAVERQDCPSVYLKNDNPKQRLADINAVLNKEYKNRYKKLIVLGGSEGALIANLFSSNFDYVDATISFSGGGRWFLDDVLHSILSNNENRAKAQEEIEGFKKFYKMAIKDEPFDMFASNHSYFWWNQMFKIDQQEIIKKINNPLLIVQGGLDTSVSSAKTEEMISNLQEAGKKNIDYIKYKNLNHTFNNKKGESELGKVIMDMKKWLNSKL